MITGSGRPEQCAEPGGDFVAVHAGQADVQQHEFGPEFAGLGQGFEPFVRRFDLVSQELHEAGHSVPVSTLSSTTRMRDPRFPRGRSGRRRSGGRKRRGEAHDELASFAGSITRRRDAAAVHFDELLDDRQADAKTAFRAGDRTFALGEEHEHLGKLLGRDADTVVAHTNDDLIVLLPR